MSRNTQDIRQELLTLRCQRGDRAAFEELIRAWEKRLFYFIRQLVKHEQDAWDILQQTWLRVVRGIGSLKDPRYLTPWLYRIARNTAINHARLQAAYHAGLEEVPDAEWADDDSASFDRDDADEIHAAMRRLTLPHREVLTLFFLQDLAIDEIASVVGIQAGTVKSRLHYAKRALRKILEEATSHHE